MKEKVLCFWGVVNLAFLWTVTDKKGTEKNFFIQFFSNDTKYPIGKSMATEIMASYSLEKAEKGDRSVSEFKDQYNVNVQEITGQNSVLVYEGSSNGKDASYRLRFSERGQDIFIDPDFVYVLQNTCRLVPAHPKDIEFPKRRTRAFMILPKSTSCIKSI